jgi:hypothetical protein
MKSAPPITISEDTRVSVQREWDGWQSADVRVGDLEDLHWWQPPRAPRPMLHAYITSAKLVDSAWRAASADSAARLLVCVLKSHTPPDTYIALASRSARWPGALDRPFAPEH